MKKFFSKLVCVITAVALALSMSSCDKFFNDLEKLAEVFEIEISDLFNNRSLDEIPNLKKLINEMIETLDSIVEKTVLYKRYFENNSFDDIAVVMNYSVRRVYQIHADAIGKLTLQFFSL